MRTFIVVGVALLGMLCHFSLVAGFSFKTSGKNVVMTKPCDRISTATLYATTDDNEDNMDTVVTTTTKPTALKTELYIPLSLDEMVKQTSAAMEDAMAQGKNRQIVRILLPRSSDNDQLLQYYESNVVSDNGINLNLETKLWPTDETWQGGIMQLYRAASLACQEILRCVSVR
jgi:Domain of unknown function (DUF1995)